MSFKTELTIEGKIYNVRKFVVTIHRNMDYKGRPTSMPAWSIFLVIDAINETTVTNWMIDPTKQLDGKLTIYKIDQESRLKEINFKKSYCYRMNDIFKTDISYATCELSIGGEDIAINSAEVKQHWPAS